MRTGRPIGRPPIPLAERFWSRVIWVGPCWEWQGPKIRGYGYVSEGGTGGRTRRAHRVAWELVFGDPGDRQVLHRCDNPSCVRPDHLFLGDAAANVRDRDTKGRHRVRFGAEHGMAKLDEERVREIRRRVAGGERRAALASEYGVSQGNIDLIVARKTWRHVA